MVYILATAYSFIASLRIPTLALWIVVCLAFGASLNDTSQGWGMYHYYVGAKYFTEVGYFDLYECTITEATPRRDLLTYDYRIDAPDCSSEFTPERNEQFHKDITSSGFYPQAMIDKGYNGTPTWTAIFGTLANWNIITPDNAPVIDVIVLFSALAFCVYSLGWRKSAYIAIIILTYHGTFDRLWGHYAQWVWLAAALIGVCQLERKNSFGALMIGLSASLAIFPAFLMLKYRSPKSIILFSVSLMTMLTIGIANGRSVDGYFEFIENMSLHSSYVRTESCCNIGLSHSIAFSQNTDTQYLECFVEWSDMCSHRYENRFEPMIWAVTLPFVITSPLGAMYGLLTLSTYYYLILAIIPVWYPERWTRLLLFINSIIWIAFIGGWFLHNRNLLYFFFFVALGVYQHHALQTLSPIVLAIQSRLHTAITQRLVSKQI